MSTDIPLDASPVTWSINIMKAHSSQAIIFNLEAASTLYLLTWPEPLAASMSQPPGCAEYFPTKA